jgi:hypothetical protein
VRLDWATLANSAETGSNGLLYVMGAGWDTAMRTSYPAPFAGALAVRLLFHRREFSVKHLLRVELVTEDGDRIVEITHEMDLAAATKGQPEPQSLDEIPIPVALNLASLSIPSPGRYALEVFLDGNHLKTFSFVFQPGLVSSP